MKPFTLLIAWTWIVMVLAPGLTQAETAPELYRRGAEHYARREWVPARETFEQFLRQYPNDPQGFAAGYFLGESLVQLKEFSAAVDALGKLRALNPPEPWGRKIRFRAAESRYFAGSVQEAATELERFAQQYPGDPLNAYVLMYLAEIALDQGDLPQAEKLYQQQLASYPGGALEVDCRFGLARAWDQQGKRVEARAAYEKLASEHHGWADDALARLVSEGLEQQEFELAQQHAATFAKRFASSELRDAVQLRRAQALVHLLRLDEAEPLLIGVLANVKLRGEAQYWLALMHVQREQWPLAIEAFETARKAEPDGPWTAAIDYYRAESLLRAGRHDDAAPAFAEASKLWHDTEWGDDLIAGQIRALQAQQKHAAAIEAARQFKTRHPQSPLAEHVAALLAYSQQMLKQQDEAKRNTTDAPAREAYQVALELIDKQDWSAAATLLASLVKEHPEHALRPQAEFYRAECAFRLQHDDALPRWEQVAADESKLPEAWRGMADLRRAQILLQHKQYDQALSLVAELAARQPEFATMAEADFVQGRCLAAQGEFESAREAYQRVIRSPRAAATVQAAQAQWLLAETHMHQRQYEPALQEFLRVELLYPYPTWQALALLQAGKCQEQLNQSAAAAETYAKLLKNHPQSPSAQEASQRLQASRQPAERK